MKKLALTILFFSGAAQAQIVNIPDAAFKANLLEASSTMQYAKNFSDQWISIDANGDNEIQVSEAQAIKQLVISKTAITNLEGIESFSNLENLNIRHAQLTSLDLNGIPSLKVVILLGMEQLATLDISGLNNLTAFQCVSASNLTTLDFSNLSNLTHISCFYAAVSSVNLSGLANLSDLQIIGGLLTNLDVSGSPSLTKLNCSSNRLSNLNVNGLVNLTELDCSQNQLINLNGIPNVLKLNCANNKLTTFSISGLTNLTELDCSGNDIPNLNVNSLSNLTKLNCAGNELVTLTVSGLPNLTNLECSGNTQLTSITLANLPILNEFNVIGIAIDGSGIESQLTTMNLSGLPNLQKLNCSRGILTSLNLTNLSSLTELDCSYNQITSLNLSNMPNLIKLNCAVNYISTLDASSLTNLQELICGHGYIENGMVIGQLQNLNVVGLANLKTLNCMWSLLSGLNLTGLISLESLTCDGIGNGLGTLTSLNVNTLTNLKMLSCSNQLLTSLNVSNLTQLESLYCAYNQITNLDLTNLPNLKNLDYNYNSLANLNLVNLPVLENLTCANNNLVTLNVLGLPNLKYLNCSFNDLTTLNLSGLSNLVTLDYSFNQLTLSNVSGLSTNLKSLSCGGNDLTSLDVSGLTSLESLSCHTNELTSLDLSTLNNLEFLDCSRNLLPNLEVTNLTNLTWLNCGVNLLTALNITGLDDLVLLYCGDNQLTSLDLTNHEALENLDYSVNALPNLDVSFLTNLTLLGCMSTQTTTLDVSNMHNLQNLNCADNLLTTLDLNNCGILVDVNCSDNLLTTLFMKNGRVDPINFGNNPTLEYICADTNELGSTQTVLNNLGMTTTVSNSYCSFEPGGDYNSINGIAIFDVDNDGCDVMDEVNPFVRFDITDGTTTGATVTNINGEYSFFANAGNYTVAPNVENPSWFVFSPASSNFTFLDNDNNAAVQNFCIAAVGVHSDVEVVISPLEWARPGFDATYKIVYKNKGNQMLSGNVAMTFNDSKLDLVNSVPAPNTSAINTLTWNYINLMPFENRSITLTLNVNSPIETPSVNIGEILTFVTSITPVSGDDMPADNQFTLNQTVVGSFDPNEKTCLEGDVVSPSQIGDYLHYNIQFENLGTAEAVNVVVRDLIDVTMFDISTLQVLYSSHQMRAEIRGNMVEFIFPNINLAAAAGDPPVGGHGNVLFKIKTLSTLQTGAEVDNGAEIFFDYNAPIETNVARTTFVALSVANNNTDANVKLYPNPAKDEVTISCSSMISTIALYDIQGRMLQTSITNENNAKLDISDRSRGIYFVKITTENGVSVQKLIKE